MELGIITFNVSAAFLKPPNVPTWNERKESAAQTLSAAAASVIGLQEMTPRQFDFLSTRLSEFNAISLEETTTDEDLLEPIRQNYGVMLPARNEVVLLFRATEFEKIAHGHWWLSLTPDKISVGFGNIIPRLVLWFHLRHRASRKEFFLFNTHFDHRCTRPMVELCQRKIAEFAQSNLPLVFIGDFNFDPSYAEYALLIRAGWRDAHDISPNVDEGTFQNGLRIDHIFYQGDLTPQSWTRLFSPDSARRLSDHDPVLVRFGA